MLTVSERLLDSVSNVMFFPQQRFSEHALVSSKKGKEIFGEIQWRQMALYTIEPSLILSGYTARSTRN
jgi:hypothetical protein